LWTSTLSPIAELEASIDLDKVADKYELAGGAIVNVIRYCTLMAIQRQSRIIANQDLMAGIQREYSKEGRTV
jgi:ATP-dependent 26S proteasome regulatory subunit